MALINQGNKGSHQTVDSSKLGFASMDLQKQRGVAFDDARAAHALKKRVVPVP